jgi:hypothetical protein
MRTRDLIVAGIFVILAIVAHNWSRGVVERGGGIRIPLPVVIHQPTPASYAVPSPAPVYIVEPVYMEPTVDVMPTVQAFYAQPTAESRGGFEAPTVDTGSEVGSHDPGRDDKRRSSP